MTIESFVDADGMRISFRRWAPDGVAGAGIVVAHGASEHSARYERFASALCQRGFEVFAPDHRGHGLTAETSGRGLPGPRGLSGILDDVDHLVELAGAGGRPAVLFGHSMGAAIALRYAELHGGALAALVLTGASGAMPGLPEMQAQLQGAVDNGMADTPMDALGPFNAPFEPARTDFDWLSRDEAEVDAYVADPWCGADLPLTYGYVLAVISAVRDGVSDVDALPDTLPVLIASGARDSASDMTQQVRTLVAAMRAAGKQVDEKYYDDARHELLNETNRDEVTADILAWLDGTLSR